MAQLQDEVLRRAVQLHGGKNWKQVAEYFEGRTDVQCLHRWQKVLNPDLVKGPWTQEVAPFRRLHHHTSTENPRAGDAARTDTASTSQLARMSHAHTCLFGATFHRMPAGACLCKMN